MIGYPANIRISILYIQYKSLFWRKGVEGTSVWATPNWSYCIVNVGFRIIKEDFDMHTSLKIHEEVKLLI